MEGDVIYWVFIVIYSLYFCVPLIVLVGVIFAIVSVNKRLTPSSWLRKILPLVAGLMIDAGCTYLILTGIDFAFLEVSPEMLASVSISILALKVLVSIFGGYFAGRLAYQNEIIYGVLTGIVTELVLYPIVWINTNGLKWGTYMDFMEFGGTSRVWVFALIFALYVGSTTLGSYFAFRQRKHNQIQKLSFGIEHL